MSEIKVEHLLWIDIESTGLEPASNDILEVAWGVANLYDPFPLDIDSRVAAWQGTLSFSKEAHEMHDKSGLLAAVFREGVLLDEIEHLIVGDLVRHEARQGAKHVAVAGFSAHFDLSFLRLHMRWLTEFLSHKVYDVSAVKLFCQSMGMPAELTEKKAAHRAREDLIEAVEHAKKCREWLATTSAFRVQGQ
jgi:oligoribonuclease